MRVLLITPENRFIKAFRRGQLNNFVQLTMPYLAAFVRPPHEVVLRDEYNETIDLDEGPVAPLIHRPLAALSCHTRARYDGGDHWIVVGEVVELHEPFGSVHKPLVFFRSRYCHVVERDLDSSLPSEMWSNDAIQIYHDEWSEGDGPRIDERESPW